MKTASRPGVLVAPGARHLGVIQMQPDRTTLSRRQRWLDAARARNRAFVAEINGRTVCARCGKQPIEWHNTEHVELNRRGFRISSMVADGSSVERIQMEMARCTPLCRRCHMAEDGRLQKFVADAGGRLPSGLSLLPKPCSQCERLFKPLRRGLCERCYDRQRYYRETETGENYGASRRRELRHADVASKPGCGDIQQVPAAIEVERTGASQLPGFGDVATKPDADRYPR